MELRIPESHISGLEKIVRASDEYLEKIERALKKTSPSAHVEDICARIAIELPDLAPEDIKDIISTLFALSVVRAHADVSVKRFVPDLLKAMEKNGREGLHFSESGMPGLTTRFTRLLRLEPLNTVGKAVELKADQARTFCDARIFTDVRPIFGQDPEAGPTGRVIIHTLKLEYHQERKHREFFVSLDSADILVLEDTLKRAKAKAKGLASLLDSVGLPDLDLP